MAVKSNYLPEFLSNQFVSVQNLDSKKLKNSKTTLNIEDVGEFQCPTFNDLDTIPQNCKKNPHRIVGFSPILCEDCVGSFCESLGHDCLKNTAWPPESIPWPP